MIKKIAHIADVHNRKSPIRNVEYEQVFDNLYKSLKKVKPDRIAIAGDLMHDYIDVQGEQMMLVNKFLKNLSKIAPLVITRGNHDILKKAVNRVDPIEALTSVIDNKNITYLNDTGFFEDDNIMWAVWKHGDKKSPWKRGYKKIDGKTYIDIYHDPIYACKSPSGFEFNSSNLTKIDNFKGDYSLFGDIHLKQYFKNKTKAYCGSLIAQDFSEGDDQFHGYLLWDIENGSVDEYPVENEFSYRSIRVTSFTDFDDLDIDIDEPTKYMRVRTIWNCLPNTKTSENERKIREYIKDKYENIILFTNKNEFLEDDTVDLVSDEQLDNITDKEVQQLIFTEYFEKIGVDKDIINEILKLDDEISSRIKYDEFTSIEWDLVKAWGENLFSYKNFEINWSELNGLTQIVGENAAGKTTILSKNIAYVLYGKTPETETPEKNGDSRYVNKQLDVNYCLGGIILEANGVYYGIVRKTTIERNKKGEIKSAPSEVKYHLLSSPDDELTDDNLVDNLTEDRKHKTQKQIQRIVGSYDNFVRTVITSSDSLNKILSSKQAEFTDTVLQDSGMDVFDIKLNEFKEFIKEKNKLPRVLCDITKTKEEISKLTEKIEELNKVNLGINSVDIPKLNDRITAGDLYVQNELSKLYKIDDDVMNLDVSLKEGEIKSLETQKSKIVEREKLLTVERDKLASTYDEELLIKLNEKKDEHKLIENDRKLQIKNIERKILEEEHNIELVNGVIFNLNRDGKDLKEKLHELKNSKTCPTCNQLVSEDAQKHIETEIKQLLGKANDIIKNIDIEKNKITDLHKPNIDKLNGEINVIKENIHKSALELENELVEIGKLTNLKNETISRTEIENTLKNIPIEIENFELKISSIYSLIEKHVNSKKQIQENNNINSNVTKGNTLLENLRNELTEFNNNVLNNKNTILNMNGEIKTKEELILAFKKQEEIDNVRELYKKAIHRNGIPTQLLSNKIIPRINDVMANLLTNLPFAVSLDSVDLKLKLRYNNNIKSEINAISGSGKERTFSSIVLKFALNQVNLKSKPNVMLLDEMMGKLTGDSVEEFIELLNVIKLKLNKLLIIEHNHELNPDHIIKAVRGDDEISTYSII